ncbi:MULTISPECIES: acyltransferase [unclassified Microbacterium]|uniref:acyltransferase family protein n=1 Tax=unclassified Microbacterium TaxID=2609290 RepID=UPI00214B496A|nr:MULTISPECIES: acyltransferase [unclassified Microbacterium]MCR2785212.1 acyltransferase [Microbacterium sp. zg.B96]MDL5352574.1 acyltransferase [Microbacterium sp. zg-YB36]WIM16744.1 acyltransferase [Microbacterium sp. zg-B96]
MRSLADSFNPRSNSIGFLRWLMAFMVIFSHAGPLAGFYGGRDLGTQWSEEQSLGGVAVAGFFFLSGFLITRSKMGRSSTPRFFWRRIMRIYPAWFLILLVTAFVLAPIAWIREQGSIDGFWTATVDSPLTYFSNNMWLPLVQHGIAGMGTSIPFFTDHGGFEWNGSAWTLAFEFGAYILVGVLGVVGALAHRMIGGLIAFFIIALAMMQWFRIGDLAAFTPALGDFRVLLLLAPFAFGILFALYGDRIPIDDRLAIACALIAAFTYAKGGWLVFGQYAFCYVLIWFAIRVQKLKNWDKHGDFSYGIYIVAWPLMQFVAYFGLQDHGWFIYHLVIVAGCHAYAYLSWHLVERPALQLKDWTPRWLLRFLDVSRPQRQRLTGWINRPEPVSGKEPMVAGGVR